MHGGDLPTEPLVSSACFRRLPRRPRNSCAGQLQYCTYRSTLCNWGRSTHEINGNWGAVFTGSPTIPHARSTQAHMAGPEGATASQPVCTGPRGTSTSHSNPPTMGHRMAGLVGWVTYDEAALVSLGGERENLLWALLAVTAADWRPRR